MSVVWDWFGELPDDATALVLALVGVDDPSEEQLAEVVDLAASYHVDAMGLEAADREILEAAIAELERRMNEADPRHRFLRDNEGAALADRLVRFYADGEPAALQHRPLQAEYAPYPLFVNFDTIAWLMNPDFAESMIGAPVLAFANLSANLETDPDGEECYAHLAIDPDTTAVWLVEPSGRPEPIADDLDAFVRRLTAAT